MIEDLFKKYLNVHDYGEHLLYRSARAYALSSVAKKSMVGDRCSNYQTYIEGFIEGYIQEILKGLVILIKLELRQGVLGLNEIEKMYHISRSETLYLLKQILNDNI